MTRARLYHCANARSFRVLWTLEELGIPYELELLPFPPRQYSPEFLARNPLGTVPLFEFGDISMTESVAICEFLVARFGPSSLAVGVDEPGYAAWLNGLYFGEATLTFPQALMLRYGRFEPEERRVPQVVNDYRRWFLSRLKVLPLLLKHSDFVAADRFTIADISIGYALMLAQIVGLGDDLSQPVRDYFERLAGRLGFKRALAAQRIDDDMPALRME